MLDQGDISLGPKEAASLGLGAQRMSIDLRIDGHPLRADWLPSRGVLTGDELSENLQMSARVGQLLRLEQGSDAIAITIVSRAAGPSTWGILESYPAPAPEPAAKRKRRARDFSLPDPSEYEWDLDGGIGVHAPTADAFRENIAAAGWDDPDALALRADLERFASVGSFDELLVEAGATRVEPLPHQLAVVRKVLRSMNGRAVLADEVGLGKTIEAGLILAELEARRLVERVLIICPGSLREQWRDELAEKFDNEFEIVQQTAALRQTDSPKLIMTLELARRNRKRLVAGDWDLVIVDEAHKTTGAGAKATRELLLGLSAARYFLMLTATPVQNSLDELYRLVEATRPGTFSSLGSFNRRFVRSGTKREPKDPDGLRALCSDVMVRWTRTQAGLDDVQRHVTDYGVKLSPEEERIYGAALHALREGLSGTGDHFRRRYLAQRLIVSPSALALSARRMSDTASDARQKELLMTIAELGEGMNRTARHSQALNLASQWISDPEKGKVIVFTGHTETLDELLRVFEESGIDAVAFHGKVNRQAAIQRFRDEAQVLVSTDAGAEGLNLQFANCVINYDLPWNPMRIEQRIGRVHRLTQERDVHVANLYSRGTVDERVYAMLKDKLRMFELLFGQVTTVLGELGESGQDDGATFESRVISALSRGQESETNAALSRLEADLETAYASAEEQMKEGAHISSWMAHRDDLPDGGAKELVPEAVERTRERQDQLERLVRRYLELVGATTKYEDEDFISVGLPGDLADDFDGATELQLAFSPAGLDAHSDAELCAPGSLAFDDVLASLRTRADLIARLPEADPSQAPVPPGTAGLSLVGRRCLGPDAWAARSLWRIRDSSSSNGAQVVESTVVSRDDVSFDAPEPSDLAPLAADIALPEAMPSADQVVSAVSEQLRADVARTRLARMGEVRSAFDAEQQRKVKSLEARLKEASSDDEWSSIKRALKVEQTAVPPEVTFAADLLTVELKGSHTVRIEDRWCRADGVEGVIEGVWDTRTGDLVYDGISPECNELVVCDAGHVASAEGSFECSSCFSVACVLDIAEKGPSPCSLCGRMVCAVCLDDLRGDSLCIDCRDVERDPALDTVYGRGWRLGSGATVVVGPTWSEVTAPDGTERTLLDAAASDVHDREARTALAHGMPPGTLLTAFPAPDSPALPDTALFDAREKGVEWSSHESVPEGGDRPADEWLVRIGADELFDREYLSGFSALLAALREEVEPPSRPVLVARPTATLTSFSLDGQELVLEETCAVGGEPAPTLVRRETATLVETADDAPRWGCSLGGREVVLERINRSFLLSVNGPGAKTVAILEEPSSSVGVELAVIALAEEFSLDRDTALMVGGPLVLAFEGATPSAARCDEREVEARLDLIEEGEALRPWGADDLAEIGREVPGPDTHSRRLGVQRAALVHPQMLESFGPRRTLGVVGELSVTETWIGSFRGEGERTVTYAVKDQGLAVPPYDDGGSGPDFAIDAEGHIHDPDHEWFCPACERMLCRACGDEGVLSECEACDQQACGQCRDAPPIELDAAQCSHCAATQCGACHHELSTTSCPVCAREICADCFEGHDVCVACRSLANFPRVDAATVLPRELAPAGLLAAVAKGELSTVVGVRGQRRAEIVVLADGEVIDWRSGGDLDGDQLALALAISRRCGAAADGVVLPPDVAEREPPPFAGVQLRFDAQQIVDWTLLNFGNEVGDGQVEIDDRGKESLALQVARRLEQASRAPEPLAAAEAAALRRCLPDAPPAESQIRLRRWERAESLWLYGRGIASLSGPAHSPEFSVVPWTPVDESGVDGVAPKAKRFAAATVDDLRCTLVSCGGLLFAEVVQGGNRSLVRVTGDDAEVRLARVSLALGFEGRVAPSSAPSLSPEGGVTIGNSERVDHQWSYRAIPTGLTPPAVPAEGVVSDAIDRIIDQAQPPALEVAELEIPAQLRSDLIASARELGWSDEAQAVDLSLEIRDRWKRQSIDARTLYVDLAYTIRADGGVVGLPVPGVRALTPLLIDDEGHPLEEGDTCPYCSRLSCRRCTVSVQPCVVCATPLCRKCGETEHAHLCPACAGLKRQGVLKQFFGTRRSGYRVLATSSDDHHVVEIVRTDDGIGVTVVGETNEIVDLTGQEPALAALRDLGVI